MISVARPSHLKSSPTRSARCSIPRPSVSTLRVSPSSPSGSARKYRWPKHPARRALGWIRSRRGLSGAVKVDQERYDFKDEEIPPGVYVLRLGLQPEDGNHLGRVTDADLCTSLAGCRRSQLDAAPTHDDLVAGSSKVNAAEHPSNLNLQAVDEPGGEFPRLGEINGGEHKVLNVSLPGKLEGKTVPLKLALVYEGKGQI